MHNDIYKNPEIIKTLYFFIKYYYLSNDKKQATFFLECIRQALMSQPSETVYTALTKSQMKDLKHLIYSIINNVYYYDIGNQSEKTNEIINRTDYSNPADWYKLENQLENEICEKNGIKQINEKLNLNMTIYDRQHSTYYGDIDILAKDENSIYIIELKKDVANHSIVGQVLKYALHFQKRLIYNLFNDVKIITIAGSYTNYAFNQLKAIGANTLIYNANNNNLNLTVL